MLQTTERFLNALTRPQVRRTVATVTLPGEAPLPVQLKTGTVFASNGRMIRRRFTGSLYAPESVARAIEADGATFQVQHGLSFGRSSEMVTVFTGEILRASRPFGDAQCDLAAVDFGHWIEESRFLTPRTITGSRASAIESLIVEARPGTIVSTTATNAGSVVGSTWPRSRRQAVEELARDGNSEAFFRGDGTFLIRDAKTLTSAPDYTVRGGRNGTLKSGERVRPFDRRYNCVVVAPSSPAQAWSQQVAVVSDPANPRHPDRIGIRPYFYASPSIATASEAAIVASRLLDRALGNTQTLQFATVSNPALEEGDVIRVVIPSVNGEPAAIVQHFIDSFSLDLVSGEMQASTRSQAVLDE